MKTGFKIRHLPLLALPLLLAGCVVVDGRYCETYSQPAYYDSCTPIYNRPVYYVRPSYYYVGDRAPHHHSHFRNYEHNRHR